jgi:hypothetical protein
LGIENAMNTSLMRQAARLLAALTLALPLWAGGQSAVRQSPETLARQLSPELRERAEKALATTDPLIKGGLLAGLRDATAIPFIVAALEADPRPAVRRRVAQYSSYRAEFRESPAFRAMLTDWLEHEADPDVVAIVHKELRHMAAWDLRVLVERRVAATKAQGPVPSWLHHEEQIAIDRSYDLSLPRFMRKPPPVFEVAPPSQPIRVLAMGDFGVGDEAQRQVAAAMRAYHARRPFTFGITLGDNFYGFPRPEDPSSPRWEKDFEALYGPMGIPIYAATGNHDFDVPDQAAAQYVYSRQSKSWKLPALTYTYTAGPAQLFVIDGNDLAGGQLAWLKEAVDKSTARWKIAYAHYPLRVALPGARADYDDHLQEYRDKLMPIFKGHVDLYVTGHHHSLQHLKPLDGVNLIISGAAGRAGYPTDPASDLAYFASNQHGFAVLDIDFGEIRVTFVGAQAQELYSARVASKP